ncbi:MAG: PQQ-dependent sugar dehydrogenase [Gammaproteobacteria bacterium]|nr:PQQ-dependent sugar dehydrogenase [Gammaproteobacteria bacterium]
MGSAWVAVVLLAAPAVNAAEPGLQPLADPLPETIFKGDIAVAAIEFVRAPRTVDSTALGANEAYARIQYLLPIPDGSGRLILNDLRGLLYLTDEHGRSPSVYLDLRTRRVDFDDSMFPNESGLAGFAFHPEFSETGQPGYGKFYTAYSTPSDSGVADYLEADAASHESVIREWTADDPAADVFAGSSREVFRAGQFAANHNIGTIAFNPYAETDSPDYGLLYVCLGDGGTANDPRGYGQSLSEPLGAIMRIDPLGADGGRGYGIPTDNPFVGAGMAPEIWAFGLRHPQQFSWDTDGRMFITEIGQDQIEEINLGIAGANYGWRLREGTFATAFAVKGGTVGQVYRRSFTDQENFVDPIAQYDHGEGRAVSSGFVYRGSRIAQLQGKYVFSELVRGRIFYIDTDRLSPGHPAEIKELRVFIGGRERDLVDVAGYPNTYRPGSLRVDLRLGIDSAGELYLLTKGDGWVRTLVPVAADLRSPGEAVR